MTTYGCLPSRQRSRAYECLPPRQRLESDDDDDDDDDETTYECLPSRQRSQAYECLPFFAVILSSGALRIKRVDGSDGSRAVT